MILQDPPSVPLLQWLARGSLKQNLLQAIRLWVWLHLLYGNASVRLDLPEPFSYADWRSLFFTENHPVTDNSPTLHDAACPCAKITADWLFDPELNLTVIQGHWGYDQVCLFEQALQSHDAAPGDLVEVLQKTRLFAVTGRTLRNDLKILVDINWLQSVGQKYKRVSQFPDRPLSLPDSVQSALSVGMVSDLLTQPDLAAIAHNLSHPLNDHQRFFIHVEYVVAVQQLDVVDEWQAQLRDLWQQTPIPPIQLGYASAKRQGTWQGIVFPVCIYYYQRGPYLCAFGQTPDALDDRPNWRNYRLDRVTDLTSLAWEDARVPKSLGKLYQTKQLPTPDYIQLQMEEAWGFDYYQPMQRLLVRFDRTWDARYIRNSLRHSTFQPIPYDQAGKLIRQTLPGNAQRSLLKIWRSRADQDAYYQANIRQHDPNVWQRLRAWRPHIEVLLPWDLRQQFAQEVHQEWALYQSDLRSEIPQPP
jgi:CRISPR-associated protein (TIGR03985 family)